MSGFVRKEGFAYSRCSVSVVAGRLHQTRAITRSRAAYRISRLGIARTNQVPQPFANRTVVENAMVGALFGRDHGATTRQARERAETVLERVGLGEKAGEPAGTLSGPERKRLEVAHALSTRPRLLLLDEVMAGLTPTEVDAPIDLVRGVRDDGVTIHVIEHGMRVIVGLADRLFVLDHGEKLADGLPAEVIADERVVSAYLGTPAPSCPRSLVRGIARSRLSDQNMKEWPRRNEHECCR